MDFVTEGGVAAAKVMQVFENIKDIPKISEVKEKMLFINETNKGLKIRVEGEIPHQPLWQTVNPSETVELPEKVGLANDLTPIDKPELSAEPEQPEESEEVEETEANPDREKVANDIANNHSNSGNGLETRAALAINGKADKLPVGITNSQGQCKIEVEERRQLPDQAPDDPENDSNS